jgi:hypothetical protein
VDRIGGFWPVNPFFICFEEPTKPMLREAAEAGLYQSGPLAETTYPRIQVLTIQEILDGKQPNYPRHRSDATFKKAPKVKASPLVPQSLSPPFPPLWKTLWKTSCQEAF